MQKLKRKIYNLLPFFLREKVKLKYYNTRIDKYSFDFKDKSYVTRENDKWEVITTKPLYFIVKDIDKYEKYYNIKLNDFVFDAGANEGALSIIYSQKVGVNGKVYSFEPDSINLKTFNNNLLLNKNCNNIKLIKKAIWNKEGTIEFFEAGTVGSSIFYEDENSQKVIIQSTTIDAFIEVNDINELNFIKMDIEGAEVEALEGASNTINRLKPDFAIASYHLVNSKPTYIAVEDFFKKINYPFKTEFFDDGEIITYAGSSVMQ